MEATRHHHELIDLLTTLGWTCLKGDYLDPTKTGRTNFSEGIQTKVLRQQLSSLNIQAINILGHRSPHQIESAIGALTTINSANQLLSNELATALLTDGYETKCANGQKSHHIPLTLHYIDWQHPENNVFQAIEQYRVHPTLSDTPYHTTVNTGQTVDLALFINGIPIVAVSYADADDDLALKGAVATLRALANRRYDSGETCHPEGEPSFYQSLQLFCAIGPHHGWYGFLDSGIDLDTSCALLRPLTLTQPPLENKISPAGSIFNHYSLLNLLHRFALARYDKIGYVFAAPILNELVTTYPACSLKMDIEAEAQPV